MNANANKREYVCWKCGLEGDSLRTPDKHGRCTHCCAMDVAMELVDALANLLAHPDVNDAIRQARSVLKRAREGTK